MNLINHLRIVLPPILTTNLTSADVDKLTTSTRESMLNTLIELSHAQKEKVDVSHANGVSSAIEI